MAFGIHGVDKEKEMNNEQAKRLMQTLYEEWQCDECAKYAAVWHDGCNNPLHKITEWSWNQYPTRRDDIVYRLRKSTVPGCRCKRCDESRDAADEIERLRKGSL